MMNKYRELTAEELELERKQKQERTEYELRAYRWLPTGMKKNAQRNPGVGFVGHTAYYPDLFFPGQKLCIEIDGGIHLKQGHYDENREMIFKKNGYEIIRIKNADTVEDIAYWESLLYQLRHINNIDNRILVKPFIDELRKLINDKWNDMLVIDDTFDNYLADDLYLPFLNHKLMRRRLRHGNSLEV